MRSGIFAISAPDRRLIGRETALAVTLAVVAAGVGWWLGESVETRAVLIARYTARVSLGLFVVTYVSGPLARGWPGPVTRSLDARWSQWVTAFLVAHLIHFATMIGLFAALDKPPHGIELTLGLLAYLMPLVMVLTLRRGAARWQKWLRRVSLHYVWLSFTITYYHRLYDHPERREAGLFAFALLASALLVRLTAAVRTGRWLPRD